MAITLAKRRTSNDHSGRLTAKFACSLFLTVALAASSILLSRRSVLLYLPNAARNTAPVFADFSKLNISAYRATFQPDKQLFPLSPPQSQFAYAYIMFLCDPTTPYIRYREFLSNILVGAKSLRDKVHTRADIVVLIKLRYETKMTRLLPEDEEMLRIMNVRTIYIPPSPDAKGVFMGTMNKFFAWNLTDYRRVLLLDADVLPAANMDYMFDMSMDGTIEPHAVIAGIMEPANAGFVLLEPSTRDFDRLQEYITNMVWWKDFPIVNGWGHRIEAPDRWETNAMLTQGRNWTFHGAGIDQGLLYHYLKYDLKRMTSIFARKVENFEPDPQNSSKVTVSRRWTVTSREDSPFGNLSKPFWPVIPSNCVRLSGGAPCVPPYTDFHHFVGRSKPWTHTFSLSLWKGIQSPTTSIDIWWKLLLEMQVEDGIDIFSLNLNFSGVDPRTANASSFQ